VAGRISEAAPVTGDEVRDIWFMGSGQGYGRSEVADLLRRAAAEFDAGRPGGPLIESAMFRRRSLKSCDIDAVDWFLGRLVRPGQPEPAVISADPWQETRAVAQFTQGGGRDLAKYRPELCGNLLPRNVLTRSAALVSYPACS
jgi:hypothetical protein